LCHLVGDFTLDDSLISLVPDSEEEESGEDEEEEDGS